MQNKRNIKMVVGINLPGFTIMPFEKVKECALRDEFEDYEYFFGDGHEEHWTTAGATAIQKPENIIWEVELMIIQNPLKPQIWFRDQLDMLAHLVQEAIVAHLEIESRQ